MDISLHDIMDKKIGSIKDELNLYSNEIRVINRIMDEFMSINHSLFSLYGDKDKYHVILFPEVDYCNNKYLKGEYRFVTAVAGTQSDLPREFHSWDEEIPTVFYPWNDNCCEWGRFFSAFDAAILVATGKSRC